MAIKSRQFAKQEIECHIPRVVFVVDGRRGVGDGGVEWGGEESEGKRDAAFYCREGDAREKRGRGEDDIGGISSTQEKEESGISDCL